MTDLTEQWKRNQLINDECYYVRTDCGSYYTVTGESIAYEDYIDGSKIVEVIEKVPSYNEWDKLNNACHELEKETACLTVDIVNLKELLKECESSIKYYQETYDVMDLDTYTLLAKLNEVLK